MSGLRLRRLEGGVGEARGYKEVHNEVAESLSSRQNNNKKKIFIFKKCHLQSVHIIWTPQYYIHIQDIKKKKGMLLHIQRTLSIVSRFREGKKQTPKTILCIFHLVSGEQAFQFYGRDIETLKRTYQK